MSTRTTLQELARQVRSETLQILNAAHPSWLTFAPKGTSNHILWHAGHALWLQDRLCIHTLTGHGELPDGWEIRFGMNCQPVNQTRDWPSREHVSQLLEQQLERILAILETVERDRLRIATERIIHGLHDEAQHSGEMYLLLKICRKKI